MEAAGFPETLVLMYPITWLQVQYTLLLCCSSFFELESLTAVTSFWDVTPCNQNITDVSEDRIV
jgi:hypothetical protein